MKYNSKKLSQDLYLKLKGTTLRDAKKLIKLSPATISRIQNEKMPDLLSYAKVCKFLGASLDTYISR